MVSSTTGNAKEGMLATEPDDKDNDDNKDIDRYRDKDKDKDNAGEEEEDEEEEMKEIALFKEGDKVLAYHGPLIYEAKVQRAEIRKKEWKYFVHYLGWSKNWDEWVGPDRLMKINEENVRKQQELIKHTSADKNIRGRVAQSRPRSLTDARAEKDDVKNYVARGRKRKGDSGAEEKDGESPEKIVKIHLPTTLKKQLVDDWEFVTQLGKLVKLPRNPTVDDILRKYLEHKTKKEGVVGDSVVEILSGVRSYFDRALPSMLLYKQERKQYSEVVPESNNVAPSTVYGAEHLLRLFVKLPELLVYVNMEEEALTQLQQKLLDFLNYILHWTLLWRVCDVDYGILGSPYLVIEGPFGEKRLAYGDIHTVLSLANYIWRLAKQIWRFIWHVQGSPSLATLHLRVFLCTLRPTTCLASIC